MWQTLTLEILCQVFGWATNDTPLLTFKPHLFPWHLGHVCNAWRCVFISFPQIWTFFVIDFRDKQESLERIQLSLEMVQLCLDRSKGCPIHFAFMHYWDPEHPPSLEILKALVIHSTRWKHAYFEMNAANCSTLIEVKGKLPILHSLYVLVRPISSLAPCADFPDLFDNTPQLRHLGLNSYPLRKLDWSSLSTLHLKITENVNAALCFITQASSKLEELSIDGTLPDNILPLTFPSLKRLGVYFEGFLGSLNTPALEELCIIIEGDASHDDPFSHRIASRFIRGQALLLNKIAIYSTSINLSNILLQYAPDTTRHLYLCSWWRNLIPVLSACSAARYLESVTYEHFSGYSLLMVKHAESWREQSIVAGSKGIGPFENIKQFSIEFSSQFVKQDELFTDFVDRFKKPFEKCGVKCSVHPGFRMVNWNVRGVPPDFYFSCY